MNMLTSLFDWLLAASLRASALTLVVLVVQLLLQRHLAPRWRYALWLPVLLVLLMPVHPESRWSFETAFLAPSQPATQAVTLPPGFPDDLLLPASSPMPAAALPATTPVQVSADWRTIAVLLWLAVCAAILLCGVLSFSRVLLRFKAARQPVGEKLQALIAQTTEEVGLRQMPEVWIARTISSPAVTGLFRPTLLLPERFDHSFTLSEVRLILQHELTHLKRRDLPMNALLCLLMALHWFNPLLWLAFLKVRADREAACDAQVLHNAPHERRVEYGHALLKVENAFSPLSLGLGFVGIFQRGAALRSRIRSIATQPRVHPVMNALTVLAILLMTFFGITRAESPSHTLGQALFRPGDSIRITSVVQTRELLSVSVEYELGSTEEASLALYVTSLKSNQPTPADPRQSIKVKKGRGAATLHRPMPYDGLPHITFYDSKTHQGIGGVYFGTAEEAAKSKTMKLNYLEEAKNGPTNGFIHDKLRTIILPRVQLDKATLEEALQSLRELSRQHDTNPNEKLKGLPIILRKEEGPEALITLDLKDIPIGEALRHVTELGGYKLNVEPFGVLVHRSAGGQTRTSAGKAQAEAAPPGNAGQIIIPEIKFQGASLEEAVEFIRIKGREFDPAKKGVNIILKKGAKTPEATITLDLKDVPLSVALGYVAELANHTLTTDPQAYILRPISD